VLAVTEPLAPECATEIGSDATIKAASWSCACGAAEVITYARPGMGELVALRLARIKAERHVQDGGVES